MKYIDEIWLSGNISKQSYLNDIACIKYLKSGNTIKFNNNVSFFVGENGTGKSTILEAIALQLGFNLEGGSKNFNFTTTNEVCNELSECITISKKGYYKDGFFLRGESFFNVATEVKRLGVKGYGTKSLHNISHGESIVALFENRFRGNGLYILDEPEAALSPTRILSIIYYINELVNDNSQFIIATHSPILLAYPQADIFELSQDGIKRVAYKDTMLFNTYKEFLNNSDGIIRRLLL